MALNPGTRLGVYEILATLGSGGMGDVYRARDTKLGREVAVKVLPDSFARDPERVARFEREARLLASLNHPGIATLYGFEVSDGVHYLVMELVEGETLAERIARHPIPIDEAISLFTQIAEAVEAAHEKGIVHRDLKPANIKVTPEGVVKVLDFGLAKAFVEENASSELSQSPTITRHATGTGVIMGTAAYMSPEQARGKAVDKRTDIWAFGCCLYEALTGKVAFLGETVSDTIVKILDKEPNWSVLPESAPELLIQKCLRKDPHRRLQAIGDARIELEDGTGVRAQGQEEAGQPRTSRLAVLVAIVATAIAAWSLLGLRTSMPIVRAAISLPEGTELALGTTAALAISPDGERTAFVASRDNTRQLYLRSLDEMDAQLIEGTEGARMPFFSPDGRWLGFFMDGELRKVSVTGGAVIQITEISGDIRGASWGDDDRIVFAPDNHVGIARVSAEGEDFEWLTTPAKEQGEKSHRFPEVLPGANAVVFTLGTGDIETFDDASIAVLSLDTGEYRVLLEGGTNPRYSATGHLVYSHGDALFAVPFDVSELQLQGTAVPILDGVTSSRGTGSAEFSIALDGSLIYAPGRSWEEENLIVWVDRTGRSEPLIDTPRPFREPRLSPDNQFVTFWIDGANTGIWVYDIARTSLSRLVFGFDNIAPMWTADGSRITFSSTREGPYDVFWQPSDGSGPAERLVASQGYAAYGSWSPDGTTLIFGERRPERGGDLWLMQPEGERTPEIFLQSPANERSPVFSPDGRWIAYESDESGQFEVYLTSFPESARKLQVSAGGGVWAMWNRNGRELFYRNGDALMAVTVTATDEIRLGKPRRLFERRFLHRFDVTPDGQRFVMVIPNESAPPPPTQLNLVLNWDEELNRLVPRQH